MHVHMKCACELPVLVDFTDGYKICTQLARPSSVCGEFIRPLPAAFVSGSFSKQNRCSKEHAHTHQETPDPPLHLRRHEQYTQR